MCVGYAVICNLVSQLGYCFQELKVLSQVCVMLVMYERDLQCCKDTVLVL